MKQARFEQLHGQEWSLLERSLAGGASKRTQPVAGDGADADTLDPLDFARAYRRLCQQLALAERRGYGLALVQHLRQLAERCHLRLYRPPRTRWMRATQFLLRGFPQRVRAHAGVMWAASLLFFGPLIGLLLAVQVWPELAGRIVGAGQLAQLESMYDPDAEHIGRGRDSGSDLQMFGFYILNNISIGFRTFASGLFAGIGSGFVLVFNGVFIGSAAGHLTAIGYGAPFWGFVAGHSAPELLGIMISGGAGLQLGLALLAPGQRSRARAFREAGIEGARLIAGVFALLLFAAFVEAFWSSIGWMPALVKYAAGIGLWSLLLAWLLLAGRGAAHAD
ncbi:MAG: stage II sporulation protein M [Aquimonas sp.]|nr:stage II sporulation protein M [Aquimonas sp.]